MRLVAKSEMVSRPTPGRMSASFSRWLEDVIVSLPKLLSRSPSALCSDRANLGPSPWPAFPPTVNPSQFCLTSPNVYQLLIRPGESSP